MATVLCPHCRKLMTEQPLCPYCGEVVNEAMLSLRERLQGETELRYTLKVLLRYAIGFPLMLVVAAISCIVLLKLF